jgi:hypothetical protein
LAQELLEFGPIPLLLSHDAEQLRRRYFLRIITPDDVKDAQVWLEAYPRCQQDAAHFLRAQLILTLKDMTPFGMQIFAPNERNRTVYQFWDFQANDPSVLQADSFRAQIPFGWKQITNY